MKKILSLLLVSFLILLLSCSEDQPTETTEPENSAPNIQSITASPPYGVMSEISSLSCIATDSDGDELTYIWSTNDGTFPNGANGLSVNWNAPNYEGTFIVNVTVSDVKETLMDSIAIWVSYPRCPGVPIVEYSGKTYNTVQIGNQCWLKENLDVGIMIIGSELQSNNGLLEKYCYDNDESNCDKYGGLYQWDELMKYVTTEGTQGICPSGWHIPRKTDLETLKFLVDESSSALRTKGTNTSGFSALFGGSRHYQDATFNSIDNAIYFWSSSDYGSSDAYYMTPTSNTDDIIYIRDVIQNYGFSVRCIKD